MFHRGFREKDGVISKLFAVCLYSEWCEGQVTEYLVATFGDYFMDVKM
ncbi:hypothetical protein CK203_016058 [Vitis vinifera]|uniref:Uncharacterized protein n=1 Tax=Vitis vinifera TaxID=29760 RepID=A0A438JN46_VITVI|nr:hypothetical protein CK203_016058 [Vitis vinifera]